MLRWKPRTFGERRLYALTALLLDTGLRINEAFELRRAEINLDGLLITVRHGKGGKERVVPMSIQGRKILVRWFALHDFDRVFPSRDGRKLGYRDALRDLKMAGQRLGISGVRVNFHPMRHSFATHYVRNQGNLFALARILGHASTATTEKYLQSLGVDDLRAVHDRLTPLAR